MDRISIHFLVRLLVLTGVSLHLSDAGRAQSERAGSGDSFAVAYENYRSAVEASDYAAALRAAEQAYELGKARFGRNNDNVAALAINYGRMLQIAAQTTHWQLSYFPKRILFARSYKALSRRVASTH